MDDTSKAEPPVTSTFGTSVLDKSSKLTVAKLDPVVKPNPELSHGKGKEVVSQQDLRFTLIIQALSIMAQILISS